MIRRLLALTAALTVFAAPVAAAHPDHEPEGAACAPGAGTTVLVDLHPVEESFVIACAEGEQATVSAALTAAGFQPGPTTGMLESLSGVRADTLPDTFWAMYLNTSDGLVGGPASTSWVFANEGIDAGPVPVDTVLSFHLQDWNITPGAEPAIALVELISATAAPSSAAGDSSTTASSSAETVEDSSGTSGAIWILATVAVLAVVGGTVLLLIRRRHHH